MRIPPRSKLVMIGDSITDCSRARPVGEGLFNALGQGGYVALVDALLGAAQPQLGIRVVNMGCGGDRVRELKNRWSSDVLKLKPDWLSIMIGINDVWRRFDLPRQTEEHVSLGEYETTLDELILQAQPGLKGLVLMTPYYLEPNRADPMRAAMDGYGAVVRKLAQKHGAILVDTQAAFDAVLAHCHPNALAWDRIHANLIGHMVLARAFLDAVGFAW
jgi:lysophospholipase L1-like esterase